jgi:hypothetical protein
VLSFSKDGSRVGFQKSCFIKKLDAGQIQEEEEGGGGGGEEEEGEREEEEEDDDRVSD